MGPGWRRSLGALQDDGAEKNQIMRLGIDFGTTRTVVAAARKGRYPVASFQTENGFVDFLPGAATFGDSGVLCGDAADASPSGRRIRSVKASVRNAMPDAPMAEGSLTALSLTTEYLRYVRRMIMEKSNLRVRPGEPLEATVAVPAHASTRQRYLTLEAFQAAGFRVLGLVNEPTAGAVEYVHHCLGQLSHRSPKRYVIVYDLGGGTFDTAAVSLRENRFDLIGAEGDNSIGGDQFDEIIATHAVEAAGQRRQSLSKEEWMLLLDCARAAKEGLSPNAKKIFVECADVLEEELLLDLAPIYEECSPLVDRTLHAMGTLLKGLEARGIDPENSRELGAVYLVGGSTLFPLVQRQLRKRFGRKVQIAPQPHASTAVGLAIASDEDAGIFVREAPTRHFGVWREGEGGLEKIFDPIIEKKHGVRVDGPLRIYRSYHPAHAVGRLRFVECTDLDQERTPGGEVTPWDSVLFPYDPDLRQCQDLSQFLDRRDDRLAAEEILETYEYAATGLVRVQIENKTHGYAREYILGKRGFAPLA